MSAALSPWTPPLPSRGEWPLPLGPLRERRKALGRRRRRRGDATPEQGAPAPRPIYTSPSPPPPVPSKPPPTTPPASPPPFPLLPFPSRPPSHISGSSLDPASRADVARAAARRNARHAPVGGARRNLPCPLRRRRARAARAAARAADSPAPPPSTLASSRFLPSSCLSLPSPPAPRPGAASQPFFLRACRDCCRAGRGAPGTV